MKRKKEFKPSATAKKLIEIINSKWPLNTVEAAKFLGDKGNVKTLSSKYLYHFKNLKKANLIEIKKAGHVYVAWPKNLERMRDIEKKRRVIVYYNI